jgi:hypothetical protein
VSAAQSNECCTGASDRRVDVPAENSVGGRLPLPAWWGRIGRWGQVIVDDQAQVQQAENCQTCHGSDINGLSLHRRTDHRSHIRDRNLGEFLDGSLNDLGFDLVCIWRGVLDRLARIHHVCRGLA